MIQICMYVLTSLIVLGIVSIVIALIELIYKYIKERKSK